MFLFLWVQTKKKRIVKLLEISQQMSKSTYFFSLLYLLSGVLFTDDFGFCHVFYNSDDECEAIELFKGVQVMIDDRLVFPTGLDEAKKILGDLMEDNGSYISEKNSVGIYAPDGSMESILFGVAGYY